MLYYCPALSYELVMLWFIIYMWSYTVSAAKLLRPLECLSVEGDGVSFAVLMRDFGTEEGAGCLPVEPTTWLLGGNFQAHPPPPGRGEGLETNDCHQIIKSCPCNEASTNTLKDGFWELLGWWTLEVLGEWRSGVGHGNSIHTPFPVPCPTQISSLALPELCPFIINW